MEAVRQKFAATTGAPSFHDIIEKAHTAASAGELRDGVLESLQAYVPHHIACWLPLSRTSADATHLATGPARLRKVFAERYLHRCQRTMASLVRSGMSFETAVVGEDMDAELARSAECGILSIYRAVFRPLRVRSLLVCEIPFRDLALSVLVMVRLGTTPGFGPDDLERMRRVRGAIGLVEWACFSSPNAIFGQGRIALTEARLSPRESQIARLVADGHENKEIARRLGTAPDTVRKQLQCVYRKTGVANRTQLAMRIAESKS